MEKSSKSVATPFASKDLKLVAPLKIQGYQSKR